jgi:hypothetical protein
MSQFILIFHWQDNDFSIAGEQAKWTILVLKIEHVNRAGRLISRILRTF